MSMNVYTCRGMRPIVREVSAIRGRSCVAAERRSDSAPDDDVVVGRPPATGTGRRWPDPVWFPRALVTRGAGAGTRSAKTAASGAGSASNNGTSEADRPVPLLESASGEITFFS